MFLFFFLRQNSWKFLRLTLCFQVVRQYFVQSLSSALQKMTSNAATEFQQDCLLPLIFENRFNHGKLMQAINVEQVAMPISHRHYLMQHFVVVLDAVFPHWKDLDDWNDLKTIYQDVASLQSSVFISQQAMRKYKDVNLNLCLYDMLPFLNQELSSCCGKSSFFFSLVFFCCFIFFFLLRFLESCMRCEVYW